MITRRQLTLFLPEAQREAVEAVRRTVDPRQAALIAGHVTLCRDAELQPWLPVQRRLAEVGPVSLTMQFGTPEVLADGAVLLRPVAGMAEYQQLRCALLGPLAKEHGAHITLLHPRHAAGVSYDLAAIAQAVAGLTVTFRSISDITQVGNDPWQIQTSYG